MPDPRENPLQVDPSERAGGESATHGAEMDDAVEQNDESKDESEASE
jgi:hypothetical protein